MVFWLVAKKRRRVRNFRMNEGGVNMCKKLIVLLLVVGFSVPAMAEYMGYPSGCLNPLAVDITQGGQQGIYGYQPWDFAWNWTGPVGATFTNPYASDPWEIPVGQLEAYRTLQTPPADAAGGGRNRNGGMAFVAGTNEYSPTAKGFGTSYLKLTVTNLAPQTAYKVILWGYEATNVWSVNSANPNSKFGIWSTVNPLEWLTTNGYPIGYGPKYSIDNPVATTDTNMPCDMKNLVLQNGKRFSLMAPVSDNGNYVADKSQFCATLCNVMTAENGSLVLYGWIDPTDWSGSMHMPLHGFLIVPEPMTIALLGLGGLALIRRKRA
jgi:hypothetical protein